MKADNQLEMREKYDCMESGSPFSVGCNSQLAGIWMDKNANEPKAFPIIQKQSGSGLMDCKCTVDATADSSKLFGQAGCHTLFL